LIQTLTEESNQLIQKRDMLAQNKLDPQHQASKDKLKEAPSKDQGVHLEDQQNEILKALQQRNGLALGLD
jgi:hypothetical protein